MGVAIKGAGAHNRRNYRRQAMSDINVTPLVDVMLVLLIIFMVTAPMLTAGVQVDLPESHAGPIQEQTEPLVVTVRRNGDVYLQNSPIDPRQLAARLHAVTQERKDTRIFVRGDRAINYGMVMAVVGEINRAGFNKVALLTEMPTAETRRR